MSNIQKLKVNISFTAFVWLLRGHCKIDTLFIESATETMCVALWNELSFWFGIWKSQYQILIRVWIWTEFVHNREKDPDWMNAVFFLFCLNEQNLVTLTQLNLKWWHKIKVKITITFFIPVKFQSPAGPQGYWGYEWHMLHKICYVSVWRV